MVDWSASVARAQKYPLTANIFLMLTDEAKLEKESCWKLRKAVLGLGLAVRQKPVTVSVEVPLCRKPCQQAGGKMTAFLIRQGCTKEQFRIDWNSTPLRATLRIQPRPMTIGIFKEATGWELQADAMARLPTATMVEDAVAFLR